MLSLRPAWATHDTLSQTNKLALSFPSVIQTWANLSFAVIHSEMILSLNHWVSGALGCVTGNSTDPKLIFNFILFMN